MNLYKIKLWHYAPKDSEEATVCLLLAEDDEQVYEWIKSEPKSDQFNMWVSWADMEAEDPDFKDTVIKNQRKENDDYLDLYYGLTEYGWELLIPNFSGDLTQLIETGFVQQV